MLTINHPEGSYPLLIRKGLLQEAAVLRQVIRGNQVLIVSQAQVAKHYLPPVQSAFQDCQCDTLFLPAGEQHKTLTQVERIWDALATHHHHRDSTLIALGGGMVGDMTGFAAACYQRGIDFLQIPTTLLAQADASIGGKTAVDHPLGKNLIGAFHQPIAVLIDVNTLSTLPDREYRSGMVEIIKAALIRDSAFFTWLEAHLDALLDKETDTLIETLERACQIKADIVAADAKEQGQRALLNLGHTVGHAIEQQLHYQTWRHGEAVALGLLVAADLSVHRGWLSHPDCERIRALMARLHMPSHLPPTLSIEAILATVQRDKKVKNNQLHFILLKSIGEAVMTTEVSLQALRVLLEQYQST